MRNRKNILLVFTYAISFFVNLINFVFCVYLLPKINNDSFVPEGEMMNSIVNFYTAGGIPFIIESLIVSLIVMISVWLLFRHYRIGYILYVFSLATLLFLPLFMPNDIFYFTYKTFSLFKIAYQFQCVFTLLLISIVSIEFFKGKI